VRDSCRHRLRSRGAAERLLNRLNARGRIGGVSTTHRSRADVSSLVANGQNNATIGQALHLAPKTIANHVSNILTKLQIADRAEAIVAARRAGLTDDRPTQP
jgi:DNA-binding NarL/FixJ family response regulator